MRFLFASAKTFQNAFREKNVFRIVQVSLNRFLHK